MLAAAAEAEAPALAMMMMMMMMVATVTMTTRMILREKSRDDRKGQRLESDWLKLVVCEGGRCRGEQRVVWVFSV